MCGIFCAISEDSHVSCELHSKLNTLLHNRGPDVQHTLAIDNLLLAGNVLWQQGATAQQQPISNDQLVLLFNGDLYNLEAEKEATQSDSTWLMNQLIACHKEEQLLTIFQRIEGPYCLILYNRLQKVLYFCRDALGRNSLIIERQPNSLQLLSTSCHLRQAASMELPPLGLYKLQLDDLQSCVLHPWQDLNKDTSQQLQQLEAAMRWRTKVACAIAPKWLLNAPATTAVSYDLYALVAAAGAEQQQLYDDLLALEQLQQTLQQFAELLQRSVAQRVQHTAPVCSKCTARGSCEHAKICVLFSGGIDCSILALLAHRFVPQHEPIELINVAFERVATAGVAVDSSWQVPDRLTAQQSYEELQRLCPRRQWQLLEVNVTREQLKQQLAGHIHQLIYPLQTVLDESLGCAFWFAANADGRSTARVALLGSGADELFGGYTRHRNAHRRGGNDALQLELQLDWQRIPARNLARDDRVIADCGKTARAPFIEEHVAQFVRSLAPQQRCCYALPEGVGDKLLLRLYGYSLGLRDAVLLKKRAIQFGSRIADKKQQANQISEYLRVVNPES
ncbi:hypothetical protein KR093_007529 [Drosophila rubida]|uniref:Asparagine synthetase [glutamine-hydrolyzing] n=1 Tax=Drosophila rubida TaxID=30044 RepID=A0AAD4KBK5_9MUSC|nr:hypothetical protein KR093_007529 [Drosophila rubida]